MRFVAVKDIGWFGAYILSAPEKTAGKKLELATAIYSYDEAAEHFAKFTGRPIKFRRLRPDEIPQADKPPPAEGSSKNLIFNVSFQPEPLARTLECMVWFGIRLQVGSWAVPSA